MTVENTKKNSSKSLLIAAGVSIVLLAVGGYFLSFWTMDADTKGLTDEEQIQQLIAKAEVKVEEGSLLKPNGNNALHLYQEILKISPQNSSALDGIKVTRALLIERIQILLTQGNTLESERMLLTVLQSFPNNNQLISLQKQVEKAKIKHNSKLIGRLIIKAQTELNADQLIAPAGNNAFGTLQEAVTLQPNNQNIVAEVKRFLSKSIEKSANFIAQGELSAAESLLNASQTLAPKNQKVSALLNLVAEERQSNRARLESDAQAKEAISGKVDSLIAQANNMLAKEQLASPQKNNALYFYTEALKLMPDKQEAVDGIAVVRGYFLRRISEQIVSENSEAALNSINLGLQYFPEDPAFLEKRDSLANFEDQQQKEKISSLIAKAKSALAEGKLIAPDRDNAVFFSQEILILAPSNDASKEVLDKVAGNFYQQSLGFQEEKRWEEGLSAIETALRFSPRNQTFTDLKDEIFQMTVRQDDFEQVFKQTRRLISLEILSIEEAQQANSLLRSVLQTHPDNIEALTGIQELKIKLYNAANDMLSQNGLSDSMSYIQSALELYPENKRLESLFIVIAEAESKADLEDIIIGSIDLHFSKATDLIQNNALYTPENENAGREYLSILGLDPENKKAEKGLIAILEALKENIQFLRSESSIQKALQELDLGLQIFNGNLELLALKEELAALIILESADANQKVIDVKLDADNGAQAQLEAVDANQEIVEIDQDVAKFNQGVDENPPEKNVILQLLTEADEHFNAKRWSLPKGKNALENYKKILSMDPENEKALNGISEIQDKYLALAKNYTRTEDWGRAEGAIARGRTIIPNSSRFDAAEKQLIEGKRLSTKRLMELERKKLINIIQAADKALVKGQWTTPPGKNAHEFYQRVLNQYPNNNRAKNGITQVKEKILHQIATELDNYNLGQAKYWFDQAQSISLESKKLLILKKKYDNTILVQKQITLINEAIKRDELENASKILEETYSLDPTSPKLRKLQSEINLLIQFKSP